MAFISNTTQPVKFGINVKPGFPGMPTNTANTTTPSVNKTAPIFDANAVASNTGVSSLGPQSNVTGTITAPTYKTPTYTNQGTSGYVAPKIMPNNAPTSAPMQTNPQTETKKGIVAPGVPTGFNAFTEGIYKSANPSENQAKYLKELENVSSANKAIADAAQARADMYGKEIERVGKLGAGAVAGESSTGTNVVGQGNAAIASQSASDRINALQNALSAEQTGTQQELTANEQQMAGINQALSGANTQQGQAISAYGTGAGLTQPNPTSYGQTVFNPATGTFGNGSANLDPQTVAAQLAEKVKNGQMTYEQASASLGYAGGAGQQFLNQALGPDFNAPVSSAEIAGRQQVVQNVPQMQAAETAASGLKDKVVSYLANNPDLNPSNLVAGNKLQQWVNGQLLGDPKTQTLLDLVYEYSNTLSSVLGVGGTPTDLKTEIAHSFVNAAASGGSITEVLNNLQQSAADKIKDYRSGAMGGGPVSSPSLQTNSSGGGFAEAW